MQNLKQIKVCEGTGCIASKSDKITKKFQENVIDYKVEITGCHGLCSQGPIVTIDDYFYTHVTETAVLTIIREHLKNNTPVEELFYKSKFTDTPTPKYKDRQ